VRCKDFGHWFCFVLDSVSDKHTLVVAEFCEQVVLTLRLEVSILTVEQANDRLPT
jgi:hypothetical protein